MNEKYTPAVRIAISMVATTLALVAFAGILIAIGLFDDMVESRTITLFVNVIIAFMNIGIVELLLRKLDKRKVTELGMKLKRKDLPFLSAGLIATTVLSLGYMAFLIKNGLVEGSFRGEYLAQLGYYGVLTASYIGWVFAASHEEVLTRGYFMKNLSGLKITSMILVSSLLFTIIHIPFRGLDWFMLITWFVGGLTYAYVYLKTGSLLITTLLHAAHNLTNDLAFYNIEGISLFALTEKLNFGYKGIYEVILFVAVVLITYLFYQRNGAVTPADNLKILWKKEKINELQTNDVWSATIKMQSKNTLV